jgi:hypothetical protein
VFALYFTVLTVEFPWPNWLWMDVQGMSLASPEHKAQWTLERHVEFQKRQGIRAEFVKNMAKRNAALAAAAPPLTGVPAEKAWLAIVASKDASAALWEGPYYQAGSRTRSNLKQAMMLGVFLHPSAGTYWTRTSSNCWTTLATSRSQRFRIVTTRLSFSEDLALSPDADLIELPCTSCCRSFSRS